MEFSVLFCPSVPPHCVRLVFLQHLNCKHGECRRFLFPILRTGHQLVRALTSLMEHRRIEFNLNGTSIMFINAVMKCRENGSEGFWSNIWTEVKLMFKSITTKLAGVSFGQAHHNIKQWGSADIGTYALIREPDNPHDPNAIRVSLFGIHDMGYLPKILAMQLASLMDAGRSFLAEFVHINEFPPHKMVGLTIRIIETTE